MIAMNNCGACIDLNKNDLCEDNNENISEEIKNYFFVWTQVQNYLRWKNIINFQKCNSSSKPTPRKTKWLFYSDKNCFEFVDTMSGLVKMPEETLFFAEISDAFGFLKHVC